jgi:hypothetical protein
MFNIFKARTVPSTPLSEFIRKASSRDKKRVYDKVLKEATERQQRLLAAAGDKRR